MRTLVYKRTHKGDPDKHGVFGIEDCMGPVRRWPFDAVIGIGGKSGQPTAQGIDLKINWIGIGARKESAPKGWRGPLVLFDHFVLFEEDGEELAKCARTLARRMYSAQGPQRFVMDQVSDEEQEEIKAILELAKDKPPSEGITLDQLRVNNGQHRHRCPDC